MYEFILVILFFVAVALITVILLQQGKGAETGASLGSGVSSTLFGPAGSSNFMTRTTTILAVVFFVGCLVLNVFSETKKKTDKWKNLGITKPVSTELSSENNLNSNSMNVNRTESSSNSIVKNSDVPH